MDNIGFARFLDELAANARPARVQQALEGWRLRAADGITRRANSVLTNAPIPSYSGWREVVEEFYRRQELPARYQISPASPPELDPLLGEWGYSATSETSVMVGSVELALRRAGSDRTCAPYIEERVSDRWIDAFLACEGFPVEQGMAYQASFAALGPRAAFALVEVDGGPVGVGIGVAERGWCGLFSVAVLPAFRRQGIGREIVRSLAAWARGVGAEWLYLQVVAGNKGAVSLYEQLGFSYLYSYHYREKGHSG
jgi:GNAT superfamily N-acetyltransferase